ncbi:MAG: hypothetical protein B6I37_01495 [Desulfobacteraceae bacterium 4572_35.2]|nr:MAG: hypothetical protein B6I37_01495 [Desulfobacteraceae bacterium 4572_35.2]
MIFGRLHDNIFSPLAGKNRHIYEKVILAIMPVILDSDDADMIFPPKPLVLSTIYQLLDDIERLEWCAEDEEEIQEKGSTLSICANQIYRRLKNTGWLEEEDDGFNKLVVMPPDVAMLVLALQNIKKAEKKNYGGTVIGILNNIEKACSDPIGRGYGLVTATEETQAFIAHISQIVHGLRNLQKQILDTRNPKEILEVFYVDFVDKILIADYKTLQAGNNPFRYRSKIIDALQQLNYDDETKRQLCTVYEEQLQITHAEAVQKVDHNISYIISAFSSIDRRLRRVDRFRAQLENRVAETVRYVDKTLPGIRHRIAGVLSGVGSKIEADADWYSDSAAPCQLQFNRMISQSSAWTPPKKREPVAVEVFAEKKVSEAARQANVQMREFQKRRKISPVAIADYIERHLGNNDSIKADQFSIRSVEDYVAFCHIVNLRYLKGGAHIAARYTITRHDQLIENDMVKTQDFTVTRKKR